MHPKPFWRLRPGDARREAKQVYCRHYDFLDWCRKRGIVVGADLDASGERIVLSRNGMSITLFRDFGPGYIRGILKELRAGTCPVATAAKPGTNEESNGQ